MENPNCDGSGPHDAHTEVRMLANGFHSPSSKLCLSCFNREIERRSEENKQLVAMGAMVQWYLPSWEECDVYSGE